VANCKGSAVIVEVEVVVAVIVVVVVVWFSLFNLSSRFGSEVTTAIIGRPSFRCSSTGRSVAFGVTVLEVKLTDGNLPWSLDTGFSPVLL